MENECRPIEELLAAFALDALEVDEKNQVEAHLENCAACRLALADYQVVSNGLMAALPPARPPARLRAQLLAKTVPAPPKKGWFEGWRAWLPRWMPVTALAAVLVLVVLNVSLYQRTDQMLRKQEQMAQENQAYQTTVALMTYPDSQVAVIDDGEIYGTLIYDPHGQVAVLSVWGLEALPRGQAYQVWLIEADETRLSGGVFNAADDVEYVTFIIEAPNALDSFKGIGVTIEPEEGSPGPTGPRVFGVGL